MKKNDKGFSLIELIVVMAIMVTLTLTISLTLATLWHREAKAAASLIRAKLQYTQTQAMSKSLAYTQIEQKMVDGETNYYITVYGSDGAVLSKTEKLCSAKTEIYYYYAGENKNSAGHKLENTDKLLLSYEKSTGAFSPVLAAVTNNEKSYVKDTDGKAQYCEYILVKRDNYEKTLHLLTQTGKIEQEDE